MNEKNKSLRIVGLVICAVIYLAVAIIMGPLKTEATEAYNGVFAQIQVLVSVILVSTNHSKGYITACVLNAYSFVSSLTSALKSHHMTPGPVIPIITIISITVIYFNIRQNQQLNAELKEQYENLMDSHRITQEKDEALRAILYTDRLTGLYSMQYFQEKVEEAIRLNMPFAMVYIDIDNFKTINDTFGPKTGDAALKIYADRVKSYCGRKYICARINGDEFSILMTGEQTEADILNMTEQLRIMFSKQVTAQLTSLSLTASFGIVQYPGDGNNAELLMDNAIIATYTAKASGKDRACLFSKTVNQSVYAPESGYIPASRYQPTE